MKLASKQISFSTRERTAWRWKNFGICLFSDTSLEMGPIWYAKLMSFMHRR